jgi:SAM-dependent methyltransferase
VSDLARRAVDGSPPGSDTAEAGGPAGLGQLAPGVTLGDGDPWPLSAADLFATLRRINERPAIYSRYTTEALWTSPDISEMLLRFHLDGEVDVASRRSGFIDASVDWISTSFGLGPGRRVIDLGCGPGLYTNRLARTGAHVLGVDFSARSIEHARADAERAGLDVEYLLDDYLAIELDPGYDLALMIMCDYCALSPAQRARLLGRVRDLLAPGGTFLFDVYSLAAFETWDEHIAYGERLMDGFWSSRPYYGFLDTFRYETEKVVLEKYTIVEEADVREYLNWFQHYDLASLTAEVEAAGLRVAAVHGDVAGGVFEAGAPEFAVEVRQPS